MGRIIRSVCRRWYLLPGAFPCVLLIATPGRFAGAELFDEPADQVKALGVPDEVQDR